MLSFLRRDRSDRWVSDAREYGGSGWGNFDYVEAGEYPYHGRPYSGKLVLPPLGILFLRWEGSP